MKKRAFLIFGPYGSGKGTQSIRLSQEFAIPHISTGDILRNEVEMGSELGKKAKIYMEKGELVPDEIVYKIIENYLNSDVVQNGFIFDGFPRNLDQAKFFLDVMKDKDFEIVLINLQVSDEEAKRRMLQRARNSDDTPEGIEKRMKVYYNETLPVLDFLRKQENVKVLDIDGELSIDGVFDQIMFKLNHLDSF